MEPVDKAERTKTYRSVPLSVAVFQAAMEPVDKTERTKEEEAKKANILRYSPHPRCLPSQEVFVLYTSKRMPHLSRNDCGSPHSGQLFHCRGHSLICS